MNMIGAVFLCWFILFHLAPFVIGKNAAKIVKAYKEELER